MNYLKQSLAMLLVAGLTMGSALPGTNVELDGCNLVQPTLKDNYITTTIYKNIPKLAYGTLLIGCVALFAYAAPHLVGEIDSFLRIDKQDYDMLKEAVFKKMGPAFARKFNIIYPFRSKRAVEKLAQYFDEGSLDFVFFTNPLQSTAYIGGIAVPIRWAIANILIKD